MIKENAMQKLGSIGLSADMQLALSIAAGGNNLTRLVLDSVLSPGIRIINPEHRSRVIHRINYVMDLYRNFHTALKDLSDKEFQAEKEQLTRNITFALYDRLEEN